MIKREISVHLRDDLVIGNESYEELKRLSEDRRKWSAAIVPAEQHRC